MRFTGVEGQLRAALAASEGTAPVAVYLFGSVARGDAAANSDVDVAVLFDCELPKTLAHPSIRLASVLQEKLGRTVQLIVLNDAPVDLVHRALRDGRLLLERDPGLLAKKLAAVETMVEHHLQDLTGYASRLRRRL